MSKRDRTPNHPDVDANERPEPVAKQRRSRFPRFALIVVATLLLLVALAPTIISLTPLGPSLVSSAAQGKIDGSLQVNSVGIGWLSSVSLRGVTIKDKEGQTVGTIDSVVVGKSLLGLIGGLSDLGTITLEKPQFIVVARPNGSNLEDLLAPLLNQPASGAPTPAVIVEVHGGLVKLVDGVTEEAWELTPLEAHVESPRGTETAWKLSLNAKLKDSGLIADISHVLGDNSASHVTLEADRFPLNPLQPLLTRVLGPVVLSGAVTGKVEAELADGGLKQRVSLDHVDAQQISFACEKLLGSDVLRLNEAKANGSAQLAGGVWQLRDLEVQTEVAALAGSGDVRVSDFTSAQSIPQTDCDIQGVVDLARLMQLLPNTLRAREGVRLTSGQAKVSLTSQAVQGGRRIAADLATENVQAFTNGRTVALEEPVQLTAAIVQTSQGWQIEQLDARSSFLTAAASGTPENGKLTIQGDLNKLAAELDQFVDLGDIRLAGQMNGVVQWQQEPAGTLASNGKLNFTAFQLAAPGMLPWKENDLAVAFEARGISPATYSLNSGKLSVLSGQDELNVVLAAGANPSNANATLPLNLRLVGNLGSWLPRVQAFVPLAGFQVSGPVNITAQGTASASRFEIAEARFDIQQLQVEGHGLHVYEPQLAGQVTGSYDVAKGTATISSALVQSESVAVSAEQLVMQTGKDAKISGDIGLSGNVARIMAWLNDPQVPVTSQFAGGVEAEASFTVVGGVTQANLKGQVTNLAYLTRTVPPVAAGGRLPAREVSNNAAWETAWSEPAITFGGNAAYDLAKDALSLDKMQAVAGTSAVVASGTVSQLASRCQLDLQGEVRYDLATWTPKLQPLLGPTFDLAGTGTKPFEVHGPLWDRSASSSSGDAPLLPLALTGKAGIAWQGAQWMALEVGQAELAAELKDSTIFVQPTRIPLSQGTLQMSPALVLKGSNWLVTHEQARVIDHVVITREMCDTWIKYVAPAIAGATETQGKFSVDIESALVPVSQPTELNTKGKFIVHNVSVGPGPLARSLLSTAQQVKDFANGKTGLDSLAGLAGGYFAPGTTPAAAPETAAAQWVELPEQEVPVEVAQGRVYHQGLMLKTKEFTLRTTGSVGISDQTLELMCEIPIRDEWLKDSRLASLKGQTLKIPVKGTITDPKPDLKGAFGGLAGLGAAGLKGAISGQIEKSLQGGSGAVEGEVGKVQAKVQGELDKGKQKVEDELRKGLKGLFGR